MTSLIRREFMSQAAAACGAFTANLGEEQVLWEESIRVPFLIRWPGRIRPRRDTLLLSSPDICPTMLDLRRILRSSVMSPAAGPRS